MKWNLRTIEKLLLNLPFHRKLTLVTAVITGLALSLALAILLLFDWIDACRYEADRLTTLATMIASNTTAAIEFSDRSTAHEILAGLRHDSEITGAYIYDKHRSLFASY
ncbi:MAG: hypothetical protein DCC75_04120, partial [Proteobacteria bacterium]